MPPPTLKRNPVCIHKVDEFCFIWEIQLQLFGKINGLITYRDGSIPKNKIVNSNRVIYLQKYTYILRKVASIP